MTEIISITTRFDRASYLEAMQLVSQGHSTDGGKGTFWKGLVFSAVMGASVMVVLRLGLGINPDGSHFLAVAIGAALVLVIWWWMARRLQADVARIAQAAAQANDPQTIEISATGVTVTGQTSTATLTWPAISAVTLGTHATVLSIGANAFPIPHHNLPAGLTPADLHAKVERWLA